MAGNGGYQAPANPAAVSGPGALSARTDGSSWRPKQPIRRLPDAQYGENAEFVGLQQQAPVSNGPAPTPPAGAPGPGPGEQPSPQPADVVTPLSSPSTRPGQPVTHGAALGPGAGVDSLNLPNPAAQQQQSTAQFLAALAARSGNPAAQYLAQKAQGAS